MIEKRVGTGPWREMTFQESAHETIQMVLSRFPEAVVKIGTSEWRFNSDSEPNPVREVFSVKEIRDRLVFLEGKGWITPQEAEDLARRLGVAP